MRVTDVLQYNLYLSIPKLTTLMLTHRKRWCINTAGRQCRAKQWPPPLDWNTISQKQKNRRETLKTEKHWMELLVFKKKKKPSHHHSNPGSHGMVANQRRLGTMKMEAMRGRAFNVSKIEIHKTRAYFLRVKTLMEDLPITAWNTQEYRRWKSTMHFSAATARWTQQV